MTRLNIYDQVRANKFKTVLLIAVFIIFVAAMGVIAGYIWGNIYFGTGLSIFIAIIYTFIVFKSGDSMVLSMTGAKPVKKQEYPHLYHTVEGLTIAAGLKHVPKAYVIHDSALNAFATGKDPEHSSIAVTTGLLEKLNRQELEGVIAHEMSHIKNYDIRVMMLAAVLVGVVALISDFLLRSFLWGGHGRRDNRDSGQMQIVLIVVGIALAILAPLVAQMIKLAISRKREYLADANGALLTRYPPGLASALKKIRSDPDPLVDYANKATAHLFISTPFRKKKSFMSNLFATHPDINDRIRRLETM